MDRTDELFVLLSRPRPGPFELKKSKAMRKLSLLVTGIERTESRLDEIAGSEYGCPRVMEESMTDAERDSLEANITGFLVECRAGLDGVSREILSSNYLETNAMRLALDRIKQLSARFDRLQQLRYHRDLLKRRAVSTSQKNDPWKSSRDRAAKTRRREEAGLDEPRTEAVVESSYAKTPNQRQQLVLQKEREILATQVERDLDAAKRVESRMQQITQLMSTFSSLVSEQQETIAGLFDVVEDTVDVIDKGGAQLQNAVRRSSTFPVFFNTLVLSAAFILLVMHWTHS